ncbi:MAG: DNA-processing protein DprA [Lachnospiraceae bacterium]|nr:DNA-processing protein DprA [Lachnospiraceae bacterium]
MGIEYLPAFDRRFPEKLLTIPNPPSGIYFEGKLPDPDKPSVAIIGARVCSEYGRGAAEYFAKTLAENGIQIISGMARGIDGIGQRSAIMSGGETFGVLGCGIDVIYPEENRELFKQVIQHGGLISEYPPGESGRPAYFSQRNRIISGLSDLVLVLEARLHSGTAITVRHALEQGKDVFAMPGRITDPLSVGCNTLIRDGAGIALSPEEILEALGIKQRKKKTARGKAAAGFSGSEAMVLRALDFKPLSFGEVLEKTALTPSELTETLLSLQLAGAAKETGRGYYIKKCVIPEEQELTTSF